MRTLLLVLFSCGLLACQPTVIAQPRQAAHAATPPATLQTGSEQLSRYLPALKGKRVGVLVNQTSMVGEQHLVDVLLANQVNIVSIFSPEHGFRGDHDAGANVSSGIDSKTGIPLLSLYGASKQPSAAQMQQLDVVIFDIQDVGVRFYTYISSMHYMLAAAAEHGVAMLVLDRPNPNGAYVDGPVLDRQFQSFVGMHPIPLLHGMTVGELAQMIKGEQWIANADQLHLTVIPLTGYQRTMPYNLPVKPSPNLPNAQAIALYPSLGWFEATPLSIGRGTAFPFQLIGYDKFGLGDFAFTPVSTPGAALSPPLMDQPLTGEDLRQVNAGGLNLTYLLRWHALFKQHNTPFFTAPAFMDKLAGTDQLRQQIEQGLTEQQIRASWQPALARFLQQRQRYLLYP